jgi:hypothetical protein
MLVGCYGTIDGADYGFDGPLVEPPPEANTGCASSCHGAAANNAPPKSISGATETTAAGVGAHQNHVAGSTWHRPVVCSDCHSVPATIDSPGHQDGDNKAELTFGPVAGATATWSGTTCTVGCHNAGGTSAVPIWTKVDGTQTACGGCHSTTGANMSGEHRRHIVEENMQCSECHGDVIGADRVFRDPAMHVNGVRDVKMIAGTFDPATRQCANTGCHGVERW